MRCLLMVYLLKCLVILLQNSQPLSPSKYVQTIIPNLAPLIYPSQSHRVHIDIATARNHNGLVTPKQISVPPRWPCQHSMTCCIHFGVTEMFNQSHRVGLTDSLFLIAFASISLIRVSFSPRWPCQHSVTC